ncbi:glycoside hydrolase family 65 [Paenibacillus filicis]|uniref:Glycoside hydrolase family 65 n=1 Tax=Paenibacillus gyeongsangnamensis TaxID=3388067 RepID=A0ABT4QA63_9BACL|nr:glycoside hydrolase family 65 [Paenibacillus filicis]MCZ8513733.1 glycoside hydrolase family 65 [Paenibacillus filicis]
MAIDRKALVTRHNPVTRGILPLSPLSVGNGEFAFTADFTGLQTFPDEYEAPLGTQSQWGWHSSGGRSLWSLRDVRMQYGRPEIGAEGYPLQAEDREEPYHWLRQNPHRLQLGQIGFVLRSAEGELLSSQEMTGAEQVLDLWTGVLTSRFEAAGVPVTVRTACHPSLDQLAVDVESALIPDGRLDISIRFPAPGVTSRSWDRTTGLNWGGADSHHTQAAVTAANRAIVKRSMDEDGYEVHLHWTQGALKRTGMHELLLECGGPSRHFAFVARFTPPGEEPAAVSAQETFGESERHWEQFWRSGAAVELSESRDPRAAELERRIVLSQFLLAIHSAGSLPPQETGLLYNSWFGKPHLEMHYWHAYHFPLWGRTSLLKRSMGWYRQILPVAQTLARSQGYEGARWPKMVGPAGDQSPSSVAPLLIWQQPHPIELAELLYLSEPTEETLRGFADIVWESADFMASFAAWDEERKRYVLGPPVIPAQENHKGITTWNPTYELEYWRHSLETARRWAARLGRPENPKWSEVIGSLSPLPVANGVYLAHENAPDTFTVKNHDHPSMLGALGMLPGKLVDPEAMRRTLAKVRECWRWDSAWGWDFPMAAMTAARLGDGAAAVDLLLMDVQKNTYLPNGHNYQNGRLMAYLPGNGGLLIAVALMAAGWQGGPDDPAPGFPKDGSWTVRSEGLKVWM